MGPLLSSVFSADCRICIPPPPSQKGSWEVGLEAKWPPTLWPVGKPTAIEGGGFGRSHWNYSSDPRASHRGLTRFVYDCLWYVLDSECQEMGVHLKVGMLSHGKVPPDIRGEELGRRRRFASQHRGMHPWCRAQFSPKGKSAWCGPDSQRS